MLMDLYRACKSYSFIGVYVTIIHNYCTTSLFC